MKATDYLTDTTHTIMVYGSFEYGGVDGDRFNFFFVTYPTDGKTKVDEWSKSKKIMRSHNPIKGLHWRMIQKVIKAQPVLAPYRQMDERTLRYRKMPPHYTIEGVVLEEAREYLDKDLQEPESGKKRRWVQIKSDGTWGVIC
jgi:hypothetical protein